MKILTPPHLFSTSDEAFTSKMNGAWAPQTHWTSFMHKPPKPILLAECPPQGSATPPGGAQSPGTEEGSYPAGQNKVGEIRDKRCGKGSLTLISTNPSPRASAGAAGQLCCSKSEQVCASTTDSARGCCLRNASVLGFQLSYPVQKPSSTEAGDAPPHTPPTLWSAAAHPQGAAHRSSQHHSTAAPGDLRDTRYHPWTLPGRFPYKQVPPYMTMGHQTGDMAFSHSPGDTHSSGKHSD